MLIEKNAVKAMGSKQEGKNRQSYQPEQAYSPR